MYFYRNRYYHTELQRFVSEDPIEFGAGDINLYAYVSNMPLSYTDPYGLCFVVSDTRCVPPYRFPPKNKSEDHRYRPKCPGDSRCLPRGWWDRPYKQPDVSDPNGQTRDGDLIFPNGWWVPRRGGGADSFEE